MMTQKHTPTPWNSFDGGLDSFGIFSSVNKRIGSIFYSKRQAGVCEGYEQAEANAAFIVRACNAHDGLVGALSVVKRGIIGVLCDPDDKPCFQGSDGDRAEIQAVLDTIDRALAKARGEA